MTYVALAVAAFLAGSLPSAWIAGRLRGVDILASGSGNSGATNALRTLGRLPAALVLAADVAKALLSVLVLAPALVPASLGDPAADPAAAAALAGLCCSLGHVKSPWLGFRGGKGVATGAAAAFAVAPLAAPFSLAAFAAVLAATRYVSLASLVAAAVLPIAYAAVYGFLARAFAWPSFVFCVLASALVFAAHRANIGRLASGAERRLGERA